MITSLKSWFTKTSAALPAANTTDPSTGRASRGTTTSGGASRKDLRNGKRELLYSVVRETLVGAGILSSCYKFKVLTLDSRASRFLIMVDTTDQFKSGQRTLRELEALICHNAMGRYGLSVSAVYWRTSADAISLPRQNQSAPIRPVARAMPVVNPGSPRFEPLSKSELSGFQETMTLLQTYQVRGGGSMKPGNMAPHPQFAETKIEEYDDCPIGATQYGALN